MHREEEVNKDAYALFHDNSRGKDIYDLYNACDGVVVNGLLDVSQLDEYTPAEAEELDVPMLKVIWRHTATGCPECADIVAALNDIRGGLGDEEDEPIDDRKKALDFDVIDSI